MSTLVKINIDWADEFGWHCPCCRGEIDHLNGMIHDEEGYTDDSYQCVDNGGDLCKRVYLMVRWSHTQKGSNGDTLTLERWMEVEFNEPDDDPEIIPFPFAGIEPLLPGEPGYEDGFETHSDDEGK